MGSDEYGAMRAYQPQPREPGQAPRREGPRDARRPEEPDALEGLPEGSDVAELLGFAQGSAVPGPPPGSDAWLRLQTRQLIREFLRAVPRSEPEATIAIVRPDGTPRLLTRAQLSAAIDRLRPRQRQIMRLAVEERWPRQKVCEYLNHISIKTFERDQVEALDLLAQL
jgi:hypothetical protein